MKRDKTSSQEDWNKKLNSSKNFLKNFHEAAEKINEVYLPTKKTSRTKLKLNLFNSNVDVLKSAIFARLPKPTVSRRFSDANDQIGRVASNILQRALTFDISSTPKFRDAAKQCLQDYLVSGSGWMYCFYNAEVDNPIIPTSSEIDDLAEGSVVIKNQNVGIEFISYKDVLWSPARKWDEVSWWARRVWLNKEDFTQRFGKEKARDIDFDKSPEDEDAIDIIDGKIGVWEIWNKLDRKIYFIACSADEVLDEIEDPYGLPEFFPTTPFFANVNNEQFIPVADFQILETQYRSLDELNTRINRLARSIRLAGVYNAEHPEVKQLLELPGDSVMIPLANWSSFSEKGGLQGAFSFMPIQEFSAVIANLQANKAEQAAQIEQISGISDIVRGSGGNPYESAAASKMKSQYASVRLGNRADEFARVMTYAIQCFSHFICKFYTAEQILSRIGTISEADQQYLQPALQLLGDELTRMFLIEVSTDSLKAEDFARDTEEKSLVLQQLSSYIPQAIQGAQQIPELAPIFFELMRWVVSGTRGAREIEGILDSTIQQYNAMMTEKAKNPQDEKPDPAMEQIKAQIQMNQMTQETERIKIQQQGQIEQAKLQQAFQLKQMELENERQKLMIEQQKLMLEQEKVAIARDEVETKALIETERLKQTDTHYMMSLVKPKMAQDGSRELSDEEIMEEEEKKRLIEEEINREKQAHEEKLNMLQLSLEQIQNNLNTPQKITVYRDADGKLVGNVE